MALPETGDGDGSNKNNSRVGEGGAALHWGFPSRGSGMCPDGSRDRPGGPSLSLSSRGGEKKAKSIENPWKIPGFQCCSQLQCWTWEISLSCGIQGFLWNKEENSFAPARASLMYPVVFSPAAQDSSNSQGKIPSPQAFPASPAVIPCSWGRLFLSCCVLVEL